MIKKVTKKLNLVLSFVFAFACLLTGVCFVANNCEKQEKIQANASSVYESDFLENFTQVEYIESTGTQYINTGTKLNQDSRVVIDFEVVSITYEDGIFGAVDGQWSAGNRSFFVYSRSDNNHGTGYWNGSRNTWWSFPRFGRKILDCNKNNWNVVGTSYSLSFTAVTSVIETKYNCYIFALAYGNTETVSGISKMKLYSCQMYNKDTVVRNFVPCISKVARTNSKGVEVSAGTAGLYDLQNGVFYTNANTTGDDFKTGATILNEKYYQQMEYIESTGTQCISTDVSGEARWEIGAQGVGTSGNNRLLIGHNDNNGWFGGSDDNWLGTDISIIQYADLIINFTNSNKPSYINGSQSSFNMVASETSGEYTLFETINCDQTLDFCGKIYYARCYQNDVLVRDFVPCVCKIAVNDVNGVNVPAGTVGLFDMVYGSFYTNQATSGNDFKCGLLNHSIDEVYLDLINGDDEVEGKDVFTSPADHPLKSLEKSLLTVKENGKIIVKSTIDIESWEEIEDTGNVVFKADSSLTSSMFNFTKSIEISGKTLDGQKFFCQNCALLSSSEEETISFYNCVFQNNYLGKGFVNSNGNINLTSCSIKNNYSKTCLFAANKINIFSGNNIENNFTGLDNDDTCGVFAGVICFEIKIEKTVVKNNYAYRETKTVAEYVALSDRENFVLIGMAYYYNSSINTRKTVAEYIALSNKAGYELVNGDLGIAVNVNDATITNIVVNNNLQFKDNFYSENNIEIGLNFKKSVVNGSDYLGAGTPVVEIPLTTAENIKSEILNCVELDCDTWEYNDKSYKVSLFVDNGQLFAKFVDLTETVRFVASDYYGPFDGKEHGVDIKVFDSTGEQLTPGVGNGYKVYWSLSELDANSTGWLENKPTFVNVVDTVDGDNNYKTVWFKIVMLDGDAHDTSSVITGSSRVQIVQRNVNVIFDDDAIFSAEFGTVIEANVTDVSSYLTGVHVFDDDGNEVAGKFCFTSGTSATTGYAIKSDGTATSFGTNLYFIPSNPNYATTGNFAVSNLTFTSQYSSLTWTGSAFYGSSSSVTVKTTLSNILKYLKPNAKVTFKAVYNVSANETIDIVNNNWTLTKDDRTTGIFVVSSGKTLTITTSSLGKLTIQGYDIKKTTYDSLIVNNGTLNLSGNITIQNNYVDTNETVGNRVGAGIWNKSGATANLESVTFLTLKAVNGGAIYNEGGLTTNDVYFTSCSATTSGGAIYNTGSSLSIEDCVFSSCTATTSGNILWTNQDVTINDCNFASSDISLNNSATISGNYATSSSGTGSVTAVAVYFDPAGSVTTTSGNIGSATNPIKTWTDLKIYLANNTTVNTIYFMSTLEINSAFVTNNSGLISDGVLTFDFDNKYVGRNSGFTGTMFAVSITSVTAKVLIQNIKVDGGVVATNIATCVDLTIVKDSFVTIDNLVVKNNINKGLDVKSSGNIDAIFNLTNSNFSSNQATNRQITLQHILQSNITNCEISGGNVSGQGGGIYCTRILSITNCKIFKNTINNSGGGIYCYTLKTYSENVVESNYLIGANTRRGGGIFVENELINYGKLIISKHLIQGAGYNYSGGIYAKIITNKGDIIVSNNSVIDSGTQNIGGGINCETLINEGSLIIKNNTTNRYNCSGGGIYSSIEIINYGSICVMGNRSDAGNGGGIWGNVTNYGVMNVSNNTSSGSGGGISGSVTNYGDLTISNNRTTGSSGLGGGIYGGVLNNGNMIVTNNYSYSGGGGISDVTNNSSSHLINNGNLQVFSNRSDANGGGIYLRWYLENNGTLLVAYNYASTRGGGMCLEDASGKIVNTENMVVFRNMTLSSYGGTGIYSNGSVENVVFSGNTGNYLLYGYGEYINCSFVGNEFTSYYGLFCATDELKFKGCKIAGNSNTYGGQKYNGRTLDYSPIVFVQSIQMVTFENCEFVDNVSLLQNENANKVFYNNDGVLNIKGCWFNNNSYYDTTSGGYKLAGIYTTEKGVTTIDDSVFAYHTYQNEMQGTGATNKGISGDVGLIYFDGCSWNMDNVVIKDNDFTNGSNLADGVAIVDSKSGVFRRGEITSNVVGEYGVLKSSGSVVFDGVEISNNDLTNGSAVVVTGIVVINGNSVVKDHDIKNSVIKVENSGNLVINDGKFANNVVSTGLGSEVFGGVIFNQGEVFINGGEFTDNINKKGGVVWNKKGLVWVDGGLFKLTPAVSEETNFFGVNGNAKVQVNNAQFVIENSDLDGVGFLANVENGGKIGFENCEIEIESDVKNTNNLIKVVGTESEKIAVGIEFVDCDIVSGLATNFGFEFATGKVEFSGMVFKGLNGIVKTTNCAELEVIFDECEVKATKQIASVDCELYLIDCYIHNCNSNDDLIVSSGKSRIDGCEIANNTATNGNVVKVIDNTTTVVDSEFTGNNTKDGVVKVESDSTNENAIAKIEFVGENVIRDNTASQNCAGVFVKNATGDNLSIGNGGKLIIEGNTVNNQGRNLVLQGDFATLEDDSNEAKNNRENKEFLRGGLQIGSDVGVTVFDKNGNVVTTVGTVVFAGLGSGNNAQTSENGVYIISSQDLSGIKYDNNLCKFVLKDNKVIVAEINSKVVVSDKVLYFDGKYKQMEDDDFVVYDASGNVIVKDNYTIKYCEQENGIYNEICPRYASVGSRKVFYKVTINSDSMAGTILSGSVNLDIIKKALTVVDAPSAMIDAGETLDKAVFYGGKVVDSDGLSVAGVWSFENANQNAVNGNSYNANFVASGSNGYYNVVGYTVEVTTRYTSVIYGTRTVGGESVTGFFVSLDSGSGSPSQDEIYTGITKFSEITPLMAKDGVITFEQTYVFYDDENVNSRDNLTIRKTDFEGDVFQVGGVWNDNISVHTALPDGLVAVEYVTIQNDATNGYSNSVNTGIAWKNIGKVEFEYASSDSTSNVIMIHAFSGSSITSPFFGYNNNGSVNNGYVNPTNISISSYSPSDRNGTIKNFSFNNANTSSNYLGFGSYANSAYSRTANWYGVKLYDKNGNVVRDLVPCYCTKDGTVAYKGTTKTTVNAGTAGFYDILENGKKFYVNSGSGNFVYTSTLNTRILSPDVTKTPKVSFWGSGEFKFEGGTVKNNTGEDSSANLPRGYQQVEYIESTGTQYIDTGINPTTTMRIEMGYFCSTSQNIINMTGGSLFRLQHQGNGFLYYEAFVTKAAGSRTGWSCITSSTTVNRLTFDVKNKKIWIKNDENPNNTSETITVGSVSVGYSLCLFGTNSSGTKSGAASYKLYYFKVYDNDVLLMDMIPCYRTSDETGGMYDAVSKQFFDNNGTGDFKKGKVIEKDYFPSVRNGLFKVNEDCYLSLSNNIVIQNWEKEEAVSGNDTLCYEGDTSLIYNFGTINFNGCSIIDNKVQVASTCEAWGGIVFNCGTVNFNGGTFSDNSLVNATDGKNMFGGVVYNENGIVNIFDGEFSNNGFGSSVNDGYGGVIYNENGRVYFNGGNYFGNMASYGGVIANSGGEVCFNGGEMTANRALKSGAVYWEDDGTEVGSGVLPTGVGTVGTKIAYNTAGIFDDADKFNTNDFLDDNIVLGLDWRVVCGIVLMCGFGFVIIGSRVVKKRKR